MMHTVKLPFLTNSAPIAEGRKSIELSKVAQHSGRWNRIRFEGQRRQDGAFKATFRVRQSRRLIFTI